MYCPWVGKEAELANNIHAGSDRRYHMHQPDSLLFLPDSELFQCAGGISLWRSDWRDSDTFIFNYSAILFDYLFNRYKNPFSTGS